MFGFDFYAFLGSSYGFFQFTFVIQNQAKFIPRFGNIGSDFYGLSACRFCIS